MKKTNTKSTEVKPTTLQKENPQNPIWKWLFWGIALVALVTIMLLSRGAGISGDEKFHLDQAENVYNYYATGGKDSTAAVVTPDYNLPYYGQSVDNFAYFVTKTFHIDDVYGARHLINSVFGWLAMLFTALIVYRLVGWRGAVFAFVLIFFSPRFLGHSLNNLKDLPLATGIIFGVYGIIRFLQEFPKIKWSTAILLSVAIGFATSVRFAGILIVAYFGMFGLILYIKRNWKQGLFKKQGASELGKMFAWGVGISLVGMVLAILLWPFLLKSPIENFKDTVENMSAFDTGIRQIFEGTAQWSDLLPWYYTPKYILMTIPIAVIVGLVLFFIFCWRKKEDRFWSFLVLFTFFFPVFWIVYTRANVYGGWRHAMFAYPPMVVAAGLGFEGLVNWVENRVKGSGLRAQSLEGEQQSTTKNWKPVLVNVGAVVLLLLLLIGPIRHIIANHPYEYVYFNELVGGTKNQLGQYEMDYYYHSTREASEWVLANAEKKKDGSKVIVATWHTASVEYFFRKDTNDFQVKFVRWDEKEYSDWDYAIFTVTGMWPDYLKSEYFPPKNTVKTIDVDGVPIAVILKREDKSDCQAYALRRNYSKVDSMILLYQKALKVDPNNPGALLGLGEAYMRIGELDSALFVLNRHLKFEPELSDYSRAIVYLHKKDTATAIDIFHKLIKSNPKDLDSYDRLLQVHLERKDFVSARKEFKKAIDADQMTGNLMKLWVKFCDMQDINESDAYIQLYRLTAKSLEKRGFKKDAEYYRKAIGE